MTFKIEITPKTNAAGAVFYEVAVSDEGAPTLHPFPTREEAEQFKKARVASFLNSPLMKKR